MKGHIKASLTDDVREATCLACGHHVAVSFFAGGDQPLMTLGWPSSAEAAQTMRRLPLDFVRCVECGHIFNAAFDYSDVPYPDEPNLMFNRGKLWSAFIRGLQQEILSYLPKKPVVVEIGHGDGSFLAALAGVRPTGRYVGFDPHGATAGTGAVELRAELFDPVRHLGELKPDLVVSRHVLEHLSNPLGFLQRLSFAAASLDKATRAYFEVPCVDRVLETGRTVDFYYEHSSQFTTGSFTAMLARCAATAEKIGHGYDGEVVYAFIRLEGRSAQLDNARAANGFLESARKSRETVRSQLDALHLSGRRVAIWGGTGKSAAFMNHYGADAARFPLVVDSDEAKAGTFVPGTGQEIRFRDVLKDNPPDVVIIPPQWRARDIIEEMTGAGIAFGEILIEHDGRLVDYHRDPHPYGPVGEDGNGR